MNKTNDWKTRNNHEDKLVITYDTNDWNNTLYSRTFYGLYIWSSDNSDGHLIFKISTYQILVTMTYQLIHVPEDLVEVINKTDSSNNKVQVNHFDSNHYIVQDNYSNNNKDDGHTPRNDKDNSKDESHDELDSSPQLIDMKSNKIVN